MERTSPADTTPLEFAVSVPPNIRTFLYFLLTAALAFSLYTCFQAALMIHGFIEALQWAGEVTEK
jgi:hypothetical protein